MGTKNTLLALCILFATNIYAQFQEIQVKFQWSDSVPTSDLVHMLEQVNNFSFVKGDTYQYYDIYLDTPEEHLYKSGLSLRLRKRVKSDSIPTYSMQLKSEATSDYDARVEVEEKELDFYRFLNKERDTIYVAALLDTIFNSTHHNGKISGNLELLEMWLAQSVNSAITPFQYLYHHYPQEIQPAQLSRLKVKMVGVSRRQRGYVYVRSDQFTGPKILPRDKDDIPVFFQEHPQSIWLMETSLDSAVFYLPFSAKKAIIKELEIELKYDENEWSINTFRNFQDTLLQSTGFTVIRESKYRQALQNRNLIQKKARSQKKACSK